MTTKNKRLERRSEEVEALAEIEKSKVEPPQWAPAPSMKAYSPSSMDGAGIIL